MAGFRLKSQFSMDGGAAGIVNGYIEGIADNISTKMYVDSAVGYAADQLSSLFSLAMDEVARRSPEHYYHVYNWGAAYKDFSPVGSPVHRLWALTSTGSGRNRQVGFTFLPETVPSPLEPELIDLGVNQNVHVFTWKATVMELGLTVRLGPKLPGVKSAIFVVDGEVIRAQGSYDAHPGENTTNGMFGAFWVSWWEGFAPGIYNTTIRPQLERDIVTDADIAKVARQATRRRRKDIELKAIDEETGRALAEKHMNDNKINYTRRARRERMKQYGY